MDGAEDGGFEAGEGEVEAVDLRMGKMIGCRVAGLGAAGNSGAAGVGEAEDFGDLIEAFADSVVASGADDLEMVVLGHVDDLGVTTRDDESEEREGRRALCLGANKRFFRENHSSARLHGAVVLRVELRLAFILSRKRFIST